MKVCASPIFSQQSQPYHFLSAENHYETFIKYHESLCMSLQFCASVCKSLEVFAICANLWKFVQVCKSLCKFLQVSYFLSKINGNCNHFAFFIIYHKSLWKSMQVCASLSKSAQVGASTLYSQQNQP